MSGADERAVTAAWLVYGHDRAPGGPRMLFCERVEAASLAAAIEAARAVRQAAGRVEVRIHPAGGCRWGG